MASELVKFVKLGNVSFAAERVGDELYRVVARQNGKPLNGCYCHDLIDAMRTLSDYIHRYAEPAYINLLGIQ